MAREKRNMQENFVLTTAVAFCVFKSLDTTKQVFERIREAKPPKLYIVADAARGHVPGEKEKVDAVRSYIEEHIDWDCEVHKNYAQDNMRLRQKDFQRFKLGVRAGGAGHYIGG